MAVVEMAPSEVPSNAIAETKAAESTAVVAEA